MNQMTLKIAVSRFAALSAKDLTRIYRRATGQKPPTGTKRQTLIDALCDAAKETAEGEGDAAVISPSMASWIAEVETTGPQEVSAATVTLEQALVALNALPTARLAEVNELVVGKPGKGLKKPALFRAIASALEKKAQGKGQSATLPADAVAWMTGGKPETTVKPARAKEASEPKPRDPRLPAVGEEIRKRWRDRDLVVTCTEEGFGFEGKSYRSLSKIASELLGCPSNGFLFFALTDGAKAAMERRAAREAEKAAKKAETAPKPKLVKPKTTLKKTPAKKS